MKNFLYIGLAAALGAWSRWGIGILLNAMHPLFLLGTLTVNLIGGYLTGISMGAFELFSELNPDLKLIINIGFLGGLTTFSAFTAEVFQLLQALPLDQYEGSYDRCRIERHFHEQ